MSSYMCFFLRGKDDYFYPLGSYSRSSAIYEMFDEAGYSNWESIRAITFRDIEVVRKENFSNTIDTATSLIQPIFMVVIASVVGVIVASIYLPMADMMQAVQNL